MGVLPEKLNVDSVLDLIELRRAPLDGWRHRARTNPPEEPQVGSDLFLDDQAFPALRLSEMARHSLISAGEHLRLAADGIDAGNAYNTAHFTVLRGALVSAAQAVWLLGPEEATKRQERLRIFAAEMHSMMGIYYNEIAKMDLSDDERAQHEHQKRWLDERQQQIEALRTSSAKLNQTSVIEWALDYVFLDEARRRDGRLLWRQLSADAHSLSWAVLQRASSVTPERASGLAIHSIGADMVKHIAQPFEASFLILRRGWSLFDQRCEGR